MLRLALLLVLAAAKPAICQESVTVLPESPHRSLGECGFCHDLYLGETDPHEFIVPISAICLREPCHTPQNIGRSHPVDISIKESSLIESVPANLPLDDGSISCGSCHQPHGEWLSTSPCFPRQLPKFYLAEQVGEEVRETAYYSTFFLRVVGHPTEGFTALCNSCHPK